MPAGRKSVQNIATDIILCYFLFPFLVISLPSAHAQDSPSHTPNMSLFEALRNRDIITLRRLISEGANIESRNSNGDTPLMVAAEDFNVEALKALLEKGADVSPRNNQSESALIVAARAFNPEALQMLLPRVSDQQEKNDALIMAAKGGPVVVRISSPESAQGETNPQSDTADLPWVHAIRLLLDSGADIETRDADGTTPLLQAATYSQTEIVQFLLKRGADFKARDKRGWTVLMDAACNCAVATMNSSYEIVKMLLDMGVDVNARTHDGTTALMLASGMVGDASVLELLLNRGANPLLKDNKGDTALKIALQGRRDDKVLLLRQAIAKGR